MSRHTFLRNLAVARNLLVHGATTTRHRHLDPAAEDQALARTAIWLTPRAVKGFRAEDFYEFDDARRQRLASAVQAFEDLARQHADGTPLTPDQLGQAESALRSLVNNLEDYLPLHEEAGQIQAALAELDYPAWVLNWDLEVGNDHEDYPSIWVTLYADEQLLPPDEYGKRVFEVFEKIRAALSARGIRRWPYVRLQLAREYKAG